MRSGSLIAGMALSVVVFGALAGCSNELETGYKPRSLNSSDAARRGYYASPFTPEAKAAQLEREQELEARRPKPGY
jgi:hypothetical protein